ncbi:MAG: 1-deoxy-D-xylulose-5-phosphate reductoisomerase [Dehalococcoidia bacterium]|nr:MAG: 1-deoxy-D-xylulose-5-phosphate reductoisomerase [Dehalococcoidia bacterium]
MVNAKKRLAVLGCTGSIGRQTLEVVYALSDRFKVIGLAGGSNSTMLKKQVDKFKPQFVHYLDKKADVLFENYEFLTAEEMVSHPDVDMAVIAIPGGFGLEPTLAAIRAGKNIALANKESLVTAGQIIMTEAKKNGAHILPVDSEHSAIWQCLEGEKTPPARIILTASGGPFRGYTTTQLAEVTVEQALKHPSWRMGKKVTIDSATLMNKGLEVIEANRLFNIPIEKINILIHPQSIIHSFVEFVDGSTKAQLGCPDMRLPIQYALTYPERLSNIQLPRLDWDSISQLNFEQPDMDSFPCLKLAIDAGRRGGTMPAVLCAADEVAVDLFLSRRIGFGDIASLIQQLLKQHEALFTIQPTIDDIHAADAWTRDSAIRLALGDITC